MPFLNVIAEKSRRFGRALKSDFQYAKRSLPRVPGIWIASLSLAVAVGATTAVQEATAWMLNRTSPAVRAPNELVMLRQAERGQADGAGFGFSFEQYRALVHAQSALASVAGFSKIAGVVSNGEVAEQLVLEYATDNYFELLGVRPAIGRLLRSGDAQGSAVAIISFSLWVSRFGKDPAVVGKGVNINGQLVPVIGVLPKDFEGFSLDWYGPADVWLPLQASAMLDARSITARNLPAISVVARRHPAVSIEQVRAKLFNVMAALPPVGGKVIRDAVLTVTTADNMRIMRRREARGFLGDLLVVAVLILLAASISLGHAVISRTAARSSELAVRVAVGASAGRLAQQFIVEGVALGVGVGVVAAAIGLLVSQWLAPLPAVYLNLPVQSSTLATPLLRWPAGLIAVLVAVVIASLFGTLPATLMSMRDPSVGFRGQPPKVRIGTFRIGLHQLLLVPQIALTTTVSIIAVAQCARLFALSTVPTEYDRPATVHLAGIVATALPSERREAFYRLVSSELSALPGVSSVALGWNAPFASGTSQFARPETPDETIQGGSTAVSAAFFRTSGIRLLAGREFESSETDFETAAIVNPLLAARLWPGVNPLERALMYAGTARRVVGVADEQHCNGLLGDPMPCAWRPFPSNSAAAVIRIRSDPGGTLSGREIREAIHRAESMVAVTSQVSFEQLIRRTSAPQRIAAIASSTLALLCIVLAGAAIMSLFMTAVRQRRREIAIRMALGAPLHHIVGLIANGALVICLVGIIAGVGVARVVLARLGERPFGAGDAGVMPLYLGALVVFVVAASSVASAAVSAVRTNPAVHLRTE